jgi:3-hydroxyacyl-[acyl-carrier-protein] dehydratase
MNDQQQSAKWYTLHSWTEDENREICAEVTVDPASLWFSGHFPGNPILPGIAQLYMVARIIGLSTQENLCIKQLSRVKFKNLVRPDDLLKITATPISAKTDRVYTFLITSQSQDVCLGTIVLFAQTAVEKETT